MQDKDSIRCSFCGEDVKLTAATATNKGLMHWSCAKEAVADRNDNVIILDNGKDKDDKPKVMF